MYISPSFKHSLTLKEIELLLNDNFKSKGSPVVVVVDLTIDPLKQNNLTCRFSNLLQYIGMTQLLATATRNTIYSATLIDHVSRNFFSGKPDCGILDAGLIDQSASFVKLPFFCKKNMLILKLQIKFFL